MPDNQINIEAKVKYAERAKKQLDDLAARSEKVGDSTKQGAQKGAHGIDKLNTEAKKSGGIFSKLKGSVASWAASLSAVGAVIGTVTAAIRAQSQAMKENATIAESQSKKLMRLQYLGSYYKDRPQLRKQVAAYAEYGRRPFEEVAGAWYNLRSKAGNLSESQQQRIMMESLELGRTDPEMNLDTLVDMFSLYTKKTGSTDINQVQNVLAATIKAAGAGGAEVARYMPQFLPIGMSGGLSAAQSAGLWSHATTLTASPEMATTGLRAVFMGLQGKGSPQSAELLKSLGVQGGGFGDKISALSRLRASGQFGLAQAEQIAGREGAAILLDLINNPQAMARGIGQVTAYDRGDIDTTADMISELTGTDDYARLIDTIAKSKTGIENLKGQDIRSLKWKSLLSRYEQGQRISDTSEIMIFLERLALQGIMLTRINPDLMEPYLRWEEPGMNVVDNSTNYYPKAGPDPYKGPRYDQHK